MAKKIFVFSEICNGCKNCEMWCAFLQKKEFNRNYSQIKVIKDIDNRWDTPIVDCAGETCTKNEKGEAICVEMCPTGCLVYTEAEDAYNKRMELDKAREVHPMFKLIAPWKWPLPMKGMD